ncbi:hypothetical protein PFNF135_02822 [Plasmodium falciparum NF135/5.C10]|uniref:Surface antigen n=1 Tax=Plasmodium falciparum NF135/5.C10 TaxID=1036726 RepID=W4IGT2_PLAFA|nr:hypothetical protein PFNF135_02822 [Plasmodium falciparum NF135/5.C10]
MKLNYTKILLFFFPLNILVTSYHVYNKNKIYITPHHTQTNRSLCECDTQSTNYNNDEDIKSVKENFDRQMSQRFEEYEEHMKDKRKKCKEQRDKNIQEIIEKDRMDKSLAEKIEKGCVRCGCALGGVAASVGLFGGLGIYGWKTAALATAKEAAVTEATALATQAGMNAVKLKIKELLAAFKQEKILFDLTKIVNGSNYKCGTALFQRAEELLGETCKIVQGKSSSAFCNTAIYYESSSNIKNYGKVGADVYNATYTSQKGTLEAAKVGAVEATYGGCQTAIIASVVAIIIIALVMIIIYLVLRYRRKKKMNKKAQYTKLLNE